MKPLKYQGLREDGAPEISGCLRGIMLLPQQQGDRDSELSW